MEVRKAFSLFLLLLIHCNQISGEIFISSDNENSDVAQFISRLIRDASEKNQNVVNDVVVIRFMFDGESEVYGDIVKEIAGENALIFPSNGQGARNQRIRVATHMIIICDVIDFVSIMNIKKCKKINL